jgi:hypothetical protein
MCFYHQQVARAAVQIGLLCVFWIFFGSLTLARYKAHHLLVTTSSTGPEPAGLPTPAITVCGRAAASGVGWRGPNPDSSTAGEPEIIKRCGDSQNVTACIERNTFNFTEVVSLAKMGYRNPMIDLVKDFWFADLTWTRGGMCYTLDYNKTMTNNLTDMMMIYSKDPNVSQTIYMHNSDFVVLSTNPGSMSMTSTKIQDKDYNYYRIAVVQHVLLNDPRDPCEETTSYSWRVCIKNSLSSTVGCRLPWDRWSYPARKVCSALSQFLGFEQLYNDMRDQSIKDVVDKTGCQKPCRYKEYRIVEGPIPFSKKFEEYSSVFALWLISTETVISVQEKVYPLTSLVAEFGGTLGLFLGFSFMALWDGAGHLAAWGRKAMPS